MKTIVNVLFCLLLSFILVNLGFHYYTWQFWAFGIPIIVIYKIIEEKLFKNTKNK